MENQLSDGTAAVPHIVITEPSPMVQNTSVVSIAEKAGSPAEAKVVDSAYAVQNGAPHKQPISEQITEASVEEPEVSSGDFTPAPECTECLVSVPEPESQTAEVAITASSESDQDDFRTSTTRCSSMCMACVLRFERIWDMVDDRFRLPFWTILMALPISAGIMGSLYMFSCPAAETLPSSIFSVGVSLLAVLTFRICLVLHRMTREESDFRHYLVTMIFIAAFVMVIFFITESMIFWQMYSTLDPGSEKYCNATFVQYAFWWNCVMWLFLLPLIFAP